MAKTKTPFLSLGSQGSIGNALTTQKRGRLTMLRAKPIPTYRRTLPQQYQRWLYEDYAYLWTQQTEATKRTYAATGSRYHLTGFQYWMKYNLTNLPDIVALWHLDESAGAIAYDSSRNNNNGTITGASPILGTIDGAQNFDGLNDRIIIPSSATALNLTTTSFTFIFFVNPTNFTVNRWLYSRGLWNTDGLDIFLDTIARIRLRVYQAGAIQLPYNTNARLTAGVFNFVGIVANDGVVTYYINSTSYSTTPNILAPASANRNAYIGSYNGASFLLGILDHLIIYNRALDSTEVLRHSLRRYPL